MIPRTMVKDSYSFFLICYLLDARRAFGRAGSVTFALNVLAPWAELVVASGRDLCWCILKHLTILSCWPLQLPDLYVRS